MKLPKRLRKPSKTSWIQFIYFNFGGVVFFLSGYFVFSLLYGVLSWHWLIAKGIGDLIGWKLNYFVQHYLTFREHSKARGHKKTLKKYVPFSLANTVIDYAIVGTLKLMGISPFLGIIISASFFTIWKYFWYKHYIFKHKK